VKHEQFIKHIIRLPKAVRYSIYHTFTQGSEREATMEMIQRKHVILRAALVYSIHAQQLSASCWVSSVPPAG